MLVIDTPTSVSDLSGPTVSGGDGVWVVNDSVQITSTGSLVVENAGLVVLGQRLQIDAGGSLRVGRLNSVGAPVDGGFLHAPNLALAYGLGSSTIVNGESQSGDLFVYGSRVDAWCFWGLFNSDSTVDIRHSSINGFGRVAGAASRLEHVTFDKSHGRYGVLSPKGVVAAMDSLTVGGAQPDSGTGASCGIYVNPTYVTEMSVRGLDVRTPQLAYCENGSATCRLYDVKAQSLSCQFAAASNVVIELYATLRVVSPSDVVLDVATSFGTRRVACAAGVTEVPVQYGRITRVETVVDSTISVDGNVVVVSGNMTYAVSGGGGEGTPRIVPVLI